MRRGTLALVLNTMARLFLHCLLVTLALWSESTNGQDASYWNQYGKEQIEKAINLEKFNQNVAKNVIVFIGDGMGITTNTAARILKGQLAGGTGEEAYLTWDEFPHVSLAKVYNTDRQVPDSAGTGTALFCGVKTKISVIGVDDTVEFGNCSSAQGAAVDSVLVSAERQGKSTGILTTSRITHATPAVLYAHSPDREWEDNTDIPDDEAADGCTDIASQLIENGQHIQVLLGGGRRHMMNETVPDPEYPDKTGYRTDGRNLINEWQQFHQDSESAYVWNADQFGDVDPEETDYLLGLFERSHMQYDYERLEDEAGEPSLEEMTEKAIQILQKNDKGFFLMVEGARIDHGHHANKAYRALTDTLAMDKAVARALEMVNLDETLLIVTADHSHVMTISGYPSRGNPIFGINDIRDGTDGLANPTLSYANGPAAVLEIESIQETGYRRNLTNEDTTDPEFRSPALMPLASETHSGEDVAVFATGPKAHLFHGVHENSYVAHVIRHAACMDMYSDAEGCMDTGEHPTLPPKGRRGGNIYNPLFRRRKTRPEE